MVSALILCGGLGTRLRARVSDRPKALALVRGRPFLSYQLDWLAANGICKVTLAAGYMGDQIETFVRSWNGLRMALSVVRESTLLGSGGAISNAVRSEKMVFDRLIVLNGDTLLDFDITPLILQHAETNAKATLVVCEVSSISRFGAVDVVGNRVCGFQQPSGRHQTGTVNAGAYVLEYGEIASFPAGPSSMEEDYFPIAAKKGQLFAYRLPKGSSFFDIGTPAAFDQINGTD